MSLESREFRDVRRESSGVQGMPELAAAQPRRRPELVIALAGEMGWRVTASRAVCRYGWRLAIGRNSAMIDVSLPRLSRASGGLLYLSNERVFYK